MQTVLKEIEVLKSKRKDIDPYEYYKQMQELKNKLYYASKNQGYGNNKD